jgi:membrane protease YdiL (CAAX protease family)
MKLLKHFLAIVFLLSIPFWILGYIFDLTRIIPVKLPISALQFTCVIAATIIVTKKDRSSVSSILKRGFDFRRINPGGWRYGIFLIMPLTVLFSYLLVKCGSSQSAIKPTPIFNIPPFLMIYGIAAYCEEIGWTAVVTDKLLIRFNAIISGIITGSIWAIWHVIPFVQTHHAISWIFWQCIYTIVFRILLTKIYVLTQRSVFATVALHATYNLAFSILPYYGSSYNPMYMTLATCVTALVIFIFEKNRPMLSVADST